MSNPACGRCRIQNAPDAVSLLSLESVRIVQSGIQRFLDEEKFIDVKLLNDGNVLHSCHKIVLASCSTFFERILTNVRGFAVLNLDRVGQEHIEMLPFILRFIYTGSIQVPFDQVRRLANSAKHLGVIALMKSLAAAAAATIKSSEETTDAPTANRVLTVKSIGLGCLVLASMQRFRRAEQFIDVRVLHNRTQPLSVHKLVLASFSNYFEQLLAGTDGVAIVELDSVADEHISKLPLLVSCMYGERLSMTVPELDACLQAARILGIDAMRNNSSLSRKFQTATRNKRAYGGSTQCTECRRRTLTGAGGSPRADRSSSESVLSEHDTPWPGAAELVVCSGGWGVTVENATANVIGGVAANVVIDMESSSGSTGPGVSSPAGLPQRLVCPLCGKVLTIRGGRHVSAQSWDLRLRVHVRRHSVPAVGQPQQAVSPATLQEGDHLRCSDCAKLFSSVAYLRSHYARRHATAEDRAACLQCLSVFLCEEELRAHSEMEHPTKPVTVECHHLCTTCNLRFPTQSMLQSHSEKCTTDSIASTSGTSADGLAPGGLETWSRLKCPVCEKTFKSMGGYRTHLRRFHVGVASHLLIQRKAPSSCPLCPFRLHNECSRVLLDRHVRSAHNISLARALRTTSLTNKPDNPRYQCPYCPKTFKFRCHVVSHCDRQHGGRQQPISKRPAQQPICTQPTCGVCSRVFYNESTLLRHVRALHTHDARPYSCSQCGRSFLRSFHLARHRRSVHGRVRPHACTYCSSTFTSTRDLQAHVLRKHTQHHLRPYRCSRCPRNPGYYRSDFLARHMQTHHAQECSDDAQG